MNYFAANGFISHKSWRSTRQNGMKESEINFRSSTCHIVIYRMFDTTTMLSRALGAPNGKRGRRCHPTLYLIFGNHSLIMTALSSTLFSAFCTSLPSISSASVFLISMFPPTILDPTSSAVLPWLIRFSQIFSAMLPGALANCVYKALRSLLVPDTVPSDCVSVSLCLVVFCSTVFCFKFFFHCPLLATSLASTLFWCSKFSIPFTRTRFCFNLLQAMQA